MSERIDFETWTSPRTSPSDAGGYQNTERQWATALWSFG